MGHLERIKSWNWEAITKVASVLIAIFTFGYGIIQYRNQDERQYAQKIYEERFKLYSELLDLSARLSATTLDSVETHSYLAMSNDFDRLYYGKMNMIQDTTVENAMKIFKEKKDLYQAYATDITPKIFQNCSIKLGLACRQSLRETQVIQSSIGTK